MVGWFVERNPHFCCHFLIRSFYFLRGTQMLASKGLCFQVGKQQKWVICQRTGSVSSGIWSTVLRDRNYLVMKCGLGARRLSLLVQPLFQACMQPWQIIRPLCISFLCHGKKY